MDSLLIVNGPNLNLLGSRAPDIYGATTHDQLIEAIREWGEELGVETEVFQSNHEGALIDRLHDAANDADGVVLNPGAYTHYSYALHDAVEAIDIPVVEVHISNIREREEWRRHSVIAPACSTTIYGRGIAGYRWAMRHLVAHAARPVETVRYGEGEDHVADLRLPDGDGPHPVAVVIHGGFWKDAWKRDLMDLAAVDLTRRGWATWNIEYRRVGTGGGWPGTFEDVAAAVDVLASFATGHRLDLERVVTIGHSAGGQLAVWAAARHRLPSHAPGSSPRVVPTEAISLAGVLDLGSGHSLGLGNGAVEAMMRRGPDSDRYAAADPAALVPIGIPMTVLHGSEDDVVPPAIAEGFARSARAAGDAVDLEIVPGAGHFDLIEPHSEAWSAVAAAVSNGR